MDKGGFKMKMSETKRLTRLCQYIRYSSVFHLNFWRRSLQLTHNIGEMTTSVR